ncbi:MAG: DUF6770 family protein, partial [Bacteroidia bacterium]
LKIYDNNLKLAHDIEMVQPKNQFLLTSGFNGESFCFAYCDAKEKQVVYQMYDKTGKKAGAYTATGISKTEMMQLVQYQESEDESFSGGLAAVPGKGFVRYGMEKSKGMHASVEMFDNTGKKKWASTSGVPAGEKSYESAFPFYANENVVVSMFFTREKLLSMDEMEFFITFNDVETGKEKFRLSSKMGSGQKYVHFPIGTTYDATTKEYYVYGEYYAAGKRPVKDKSEGIYIQTVDIDGKVKKQSYTHWKKDVAKKFPAKHKAGNEDERNITIHNIIRTNDGKFFVVAEQFKKAVSGLGVASLLLNGNNSDMSTAQMNMYDIVVYEFTPELTLNSIEVIEKQKTVAYLPRGYGMMSANLLAFLLKGYGSFDYEFTSVAPDCKTFNVCYVNFDREKGAASNYVIGNIAYNKEQKLVNDPMRLEKKPTWFSVKPAKAGYITVFEYFRKEKKVTMRLEKLNI